VSWWLWALLGLLLLVAEVLTPGGFFVLFFGLGALAVGGLVAAGMAAPVWLQWLLFSVLSLASLVLLRPPLIRWMGTGRTEPVDSLVGEIAVLLETVAPGAIGKAELRGTSWTVRNGGARPLQQGERARVGRVDGLMLELRPE
jgi:membrane protein implicated in regulation of membrane protease activity